MAVEKQVAVILVDTVDDFFELTADFKAQLSACFLLADMQDAFVDVAAVNADYINRALAGNVGNIH